MHGFSGSDITDVVNVNYLGLRSTTPRLAEDYNLLLKDEDIYHFFFTDTRTIIENEI